MRMRCMSLKLRRTLSESGRTLVLRIPKDIQRTLGLRAGNEVHISVEKGKIIIEPID
jgi:AbrB family looped-hinge helix DNA binding protein